METTTVPQRGQYVSNDGHIFCTVSYADKHTVTCYDENAEQVTISNFVFTHNFHRIGD